MEVFPAATGLCLWFCLTLWGAHYFPALAAPSEIVDFGRSKVPPKVRHWTYHGHDKKGPENWATEFPECGGSRQSPIDIRPEATLYDPSLGDRPLRLLNFNRESSQASFNKGNLLCNFTNNGHSAVVMVSGEMRVEGADLSGQYRTDSFHFHWGHHSAFGSEHAIDGVKYPLEMHVLIYNTRYGSKESAVGKPDGLVVLAVMFELSNNDNPEFEPFDEALKYISKSGDYQLLDDVTLRRLLPTNIDRYYRYQGSLTTPGCHESVSWVIFSEPQKISERQLCSLRRLQYEVGHDEGPTTVVTQLVDNWRPLQPLGDRVVRRSFQNPGHPVLPSAPVPNHVVYPGEYKPRGGQSVDPSLVGAVFNDNSMS